MRILVVGGGTLAYHVARAASAKDHKVTIIVADEADAKELAQRTRALVVRGDGTLPAIQEEAEAPRADALLAISSSDADNLVACQIAMEYFGVPRTVSVVNDPDNRELFEALGVRGVVSAADILGSILEHETELAGIVGALSMARGEVTLMDVRLSSEAPSVGRALKELDMPRNALVAGVVRGGRLVVPRGDLELKEGDELLLVARHDCLGDALHVLLGEEKA